MIDLQDTLTPLVQRYFDQQHDKEDWKRRAEIAQVVADQLTETLLKQYSPKNRIREALNACYKKLGLAQHKTFGEQRREEFEIHLNDLIDEIEHAQEEANIAEREQREAGANYLANMFLFPGNIRDFRDTYGLPVELFPLAGPLKQSTIQFYQGTKETHQANGLSVDSLELQGTDNKIVATDINIPTLMKEKIYGFVEVRKDAAETTRFQEQQGRRTSTRADRFSTSIYQGMPVRLID